MSKTKLAKARLEILNREGENIADDIEVLFNPSQYTLTDPSGYSSSSDDSGLMYSSGSGSTLSMELFFDTGSVLTASGEGNADATDVSVEVRKFEELTFAVGEMHSPPIVKFIWGSLSFKGVVSDVKSTFTKFTETGMPIQAKVSLSLKAYCEQDEEKRKTPFESPDRTKCRMVREDYSIWDMAKKEYGDMSKWKIIAKANQILDPLNIPPGTIVKIPAL